MNTEIELRPTYRRTSLSTSGTELYTKTLPAEKVQMFAEHAYLVLRKANRKDPEGFAKLFGTECTIKRGKQIDHRPPA